MSKKIRILVADDHPVVREGLVMMLGTQADFEVIAQAENGLQVVALCQQHQPDVVLLDLEMPQMDGVEAMNQLNSLSLPCNALVFTAYDTDERIVGAVQAGAKGYLLKGAPRHEIFNAIRVLSQGGSLLQPVIASKLMHHMRHQPPEQQYESLTERENEVLQLLARGKSNKEIAAQLVITERTVKFHVSSIMDKLYADNRTEAVTRAARLGLVEL